MNNRRLEELAAADAENRIIILPCSIRDTLWMVSKEHRCTLPIYVEKVSFEMWDDSDRDKVMVSGRSVDDSLYRFEGKDFGTTVFPDRDDAEEELKRILT